MENKQPQNSEFLLLPHKHQFNSNGLCGSSGTLKVFFYFILSLITLTILIFLFPRSRIEWAPGRTSLRRNSGTCSTDCQVRRLIWSLLSRRLVISDRIISLLMIMESLKWGTCTHGRGRTQTTVNFSKRMLLISVISAIILAPEEINQLQHGLGEKEES